MEFLAKIDSFFTKFVTNSSAKKPVKLSMIKFTRF